jgi:hypothetical protein
MKRIDPGYLAALAAISFSGCGPAPSEELSLGDTPAEHAQAVVTGSKGHPWSSGEGLTQDGSVFSYAGTGMGFPSNVYSIASRVTVHNPVVRRAIGNNTLVHSLAEVAGISADGRQIVEIGWSVFDNDPNPRLFIFYWVDGNAQCINPLTGRYTCIWFVSTHPTIQQDMPLTVGSTVDLRISHIDSGSTPGWHFFYNGTDFGYVPDAEWSTTTPPFKSLSSGQWFGEVAGTPEARCSAMGNSKLGADPAAAVFSNTQYTVRGRSPTTASFTGFNMPEPSRYTMVYGGTAGRPPVRFGGPYFSGSPACPSITSPPGCTRNKSCCNGTAWVCAGSSCPIVCPPPPV